MRFNDRFLRFPLFLILFVLSNGRGYARHFLIASGNETTVPTTSLVAAFSGKLGAEAGDTIYLSGGVYTGRFLIDVHGEPGHPLVICSVPGETAILWRTVTLSANCHDLSLMDIEFTCDSFAQYCRVANKKGSNAPDVGSEDGLTIGLKANNNIKLINLVIHDEPGDALSMWTRATNCEAYGNIIYNNGWDGPDRGHGHGIYTQNDTGLKTIEDNVCFRNLGGAGIKIYTENGKTRNYYVEGNVHFGDEMFLVGGQQPVVNLTLRNNYMGEGSRMVLGYVPDSPNINLEASGNYFMNTKISRWRNIRFTQNKLFGNFGISFKGDREYPDYKFDSNSYYLTGKYGCLGIANDFPTWQNKGFDTHSISINSNPLTNEVIIRPNKYEEGRAHIIIYNWEMKTLVEADLTGILQPGDEFEVRDIQNLHGQAVIKGVYHGAKIKIPMTLTTSDHRVGDFGGCYHPDKVADTHTSPKFGVYLVRKTHRN